MRLGVEVQQRRWVLPFMEVVVFACIALTVFERDRAAARLLSASGRFVGRHGFRLVCTEHASPFGGPHG